MLHLPEAHSEENWRCNMARAGTLADTRAGGQIRTASGINIVLGIWLIIAAFSVAESQEAYWNDLIVGILVLVLAATRLSRPTEGTKPASWVNAAIGVWLIAAPFILGYETDQEMWNDIIVGVLVLVFAAWSASLPRESDLRTAENRATDVRGTDTRGTTGTTRSGQTSESAGASTRRRDRDRT